MTWTAPLRGSPADRVLDALGQFKKPAWERACRWSPGFDIAATKRLAEHAARGGDPRLAWYLPMLEEREAPTPGKAKMGRPRTDTGRQAYGLKARGGRTWASIARELGLSDARKGDVALRMAKRYAQHEGLPWPI